MIRVYVKKQSNYPVGSIFVRRVLQEALRKKGIVSDCSVCVSFVGEETARQLAERYLGEGSPHNVLTFSESDLGKEFKYPPNIKTINLGEVVLCYPKIVEEAQKENRLIDDLVQELLEHAADHLMGMHHD